MKLIEKFQIDEKEQDQRKRFVRLTQKDLKLLRKQRHMMRRKVDGIVEKFYEHLLSFGPTKRFFPDEKTLSRVKSLQRQYLLDLCRGEINEGYFEKRLQIGTAHERIGLVPKWYIGSYSNFIGLIFTHMARKYWLRPRRLRRSIMAFIKIMNLDQQLAIETYVGSLIGSIEEAGRGLTNIGQTLASSMEETAASVNQITATIDSVKSRVIHQTASVNESSAAVEQIAHVIDRLNQKVEEQASAINETSASVEQMVGNIKAVNESSGKISESVSTLVNASGDGKKLIGAVSVQVHEMARLSENLLETNALIANIASQTNLLSMNAAIEAAHAGEAGRGFAVVADEIRKLAESAASEARETQKRLKTIKQTIDTVVTASDAAGTSFEDISSKITTVERLQQEIRSAMEEQNQGSQEILSAMHTMNDVTMEIKDRSAEMEQSSKEVLKETKELTQISQEILGSMNEIAEGTTEINKAVHGIAELSSENRERITLVVEKASRLGSVGELEKVAQ